MTCSGTCTCTPSSASSGTITDGSGSYKNNENCMWLISSEHEIQLFFSSFDTESGSDYVTINRCTSASCSPAAQMGQFSGTDTPGSIYTSSTGYLQLLFTSDYSETRSGFEASWSLRISCIECGAGKYSSATGTSACTDCGAGAYSAAAGASASTH